MAARDRSEPAGATAILAVVAIAHDTEPWAALLEQGRADERLVHDDFYDARSARLVPIPSELGPAVRSRSRTSGSTQLYAHQSDALYDAFEAPTIVTTGTASGKSLCFQLPTLEVLSPIARRARCTSTRPRRWPRTRHARCTRSGCTSRSGRRSTTATRPRQERSAIRKRSEPRPHQPRHAPRRDPAPPPRVGRPVREPRVRRRRRGARLPRRVRLARRQRAAAAAPGRRDPRHASRASCSPARRSPTRSSSPRS